MGVLRFRLFGFPVDVQPGFWILALVIAASVGGGATRFATIVGVIVASVLAHELGHAVLARHYGEAPRIRLYMLGGLTSWAPRRELGKLPSILITLAGPGAGFALALVALGVLLMLPERANGAAVFALDLLLQANVFWSVVNLLPVLPFDGGQVLATALGRERRKLSAALSLIFGLIAAAFFLRAGLVLGAAIFALGAVSSFFAAREPKAVAVPPEAQQELLRRARERLAAGEHAEAARLARALGAVATDRDTAIAAVEIVVWAALSGGDVAAARATLRGLPRDVEVDPLLRAAVSEADGDSASAVAALEAARRRGDQRSQVGALLVRALLAEGRFDQAVHTTHEIFEDVSEADVRRVIDEARRGGAVEAADRLAERLAARAGLNDGQGERTLDA